MLDEKKRIDMADKRTMAYVLAGGERLEDVEGVNRKMGTPGIDFPAGDTSWLAQ